MKWRLGLPPRSVGFVLAVCATFVLGPSGPPVRVASPLSAVPRGHTIFVAPQGRAGAPGTFDEPLSLQGALGNKTPAVPGDTIVLRGGTYRGVFVSTLRGTPDAPITVRPYRGERAVIDSNPSADSALTVMGEWTRYWGFEVTSSDPLRRTTEGGPWPADLRRGIGIFAKGPNNAFINLVVHDTAGGFGVWSESVGSIVYGNLVYYNGWEGPDRPHGHGIYTQNEVGTREIADNVIFGQFSHGIHAYGSSIAYLNNITLRGNVVFNNGSISESGAERDILLGGGRVAEHAVVEDNFTYGPAQSNLGYDAGCRDGLVEGNYFVGKAPLLLIRCEPVMRHNTLIGDTGDLARAFPENTYAATRPTRGVVTALRVNRFDTSRALAVVYNWEHRPTVEVDASGFLHDGEAYEVIDAQHYFGGALATGVYRAGRAVAIPMTGLGVETPVGSVSRPPTHTAPEFGAFFLRAVSREPSLVP